MLKFGTDEKIAGHQFQSVCIFCKEVRLAEEVVYFQVDLKESMNSRQKWDAVQVH